MANTRIKQCNVPDYGGGDDDYPLVMTERGQPEDRVSKIRETVEEHRTGLRTQRRAALVKAGAIPDPDKPRDRPGRTVG